jgi:hypothetical protein
MVVSDNSAAIPLIAMKANMKKENAPARGAPLMMSALTRGERERSRGL